MRTNDPHIYAVGDAVEVTHLVSGRETLIPLAGPANRQGRIAADNALGRESTYGSSQGTAICKVFDQSIGLTGLSEKALEKNGTDYEKIYVHPASHASYYPGARQISLKLLFSPEDGRILGAQAVGPKSVDKRIDVLAVALRAGLTVHNLQEQELAYAPPYGSAKDPVNYAGFVASNVLSGDMPVCHVQDVQDPKHDEVLLDVRTETEVDAGTIPGAMNLPLDELRDRLEELPENKEILAFCQVGLRGYLACRILQQNGFKCRNLTGGYKTYRDWLGMKVEGEPEEVEMTDDTGELGPAAVAGEAAAGPENAEIVTRVDARALQCPGPLMRLKAELDEVDHGKAVGIVTEDPGFPGDVQAWCENTGNRLVALEPSNGEFHAVVLKGGAAAPEPVNTAGDRWEIPVQIANINQIPIRNTRPLGLLLADDSVSGLQALSATATFISTPKGTLEFNGGNYALISTDVDGEAIVEIDTGGGPPPWFYSWNHIPNVPTESKNDFGPGQMVISTERLEIM